jgi:hypothetical protein
MWGMGLSDRGVRSVPTGFGRTRWMWFAATVVCLVGAAPRHASAQTTDSGESVELRFYAPQLEGLSLSVRDPRDTQALYLGCQLPCVGTLMPAVYSFRVYRGGLARSKRQRLEVSDSVTYRVEYHSRRGWRIFGGIILAATTVIGIGYLIASASGGMFADLVRNIGLGILLGGAVIGGPTLGLHDRVRFVPEP